MTKPVRGGARAEAVRDGLRVDILAGRLEPGRRLTFPELCKTYSVSVGVLREALVRLVEDGLVVTERHLGFSVMALSDHDLEGLTRTRAAIEPGFVRQAVELGSVRWEAALVAALHVMERTPVRGPDGVSEDWVAAHAAFHLDLVAGTGNRRMVEITRRLRQEADLYRRWYLPEDRIDAHSEQVRLEHQRLVEAALAREPAVAEDVARRQIERATSRWLSDRLVEQSA